MAAVIAGTGLGLFSSSMAQIGAAGGGRTGQSGDNQYVNVATGNLLLRGQDEQLQFRGMSMGQLRTYNSLGLATEVGADGWLTGFERKVELLSGTFNAAGSVMRLHTGDGSFQDYAYLGADVYQSTTGGGAHDQLLWNGVALGWKSVEGGSRREDHFAHHADPVLLGRLTRIVDTKADGSTPAAWNVIYDSSQRIAEVRSDDGTAMGDAMVFGYDGNGRLTTLSTRENGVLRAQVGYEYDSAGRLAAVLVDLTPQDGVGDRDAWDAVTAANNNGYLFRTSYTYVDATSLRIAQVRRSDGTLASYTYDVNGRIRTVTQGDVNTNDADGAGQTQTFTYDVANRTTDVSDSTGRTWTYVHDAAGQLTQIKAPAIAGQRDLTTYTYDAAGNVARIRTERGALVLSQTDVQHDASGNVLWQWEVINPAQNGAARAVQRTYNATHQVLAETIYTGLDSDGALAAQAPTGGLTSNFVYDAQNRLRFMVTAAGEVKEIEYATAGNGIGQVAATRQYLGAAYSGAYTVDALAAWATPAQKGDSTLVESFYDLRGRLSQTKAYASVDVNGLGIGDDSAQITEFVYDPQGLLRETIAWRSSTAIVNDARDTRQSTSYAYDGMGRLLSEVVTEQVGAAAARTLRNSTWSYIDSASTLRTTLEGGAIGDSVLANDLLRTEVRNAAGQLVAVTESAVSGGTTRTAQNTYDTAGLLRASQDAAGGRSYFFYDAKGALSAQVDPTGALTEFVRDGLGRVIETVAYSVRVDTTGWLINGVVTPQAVADVRPETDPTLRRTLSAYDGAGRVLTQTDAEGAITTYSYDGANRLLQTRTTDAVGTASTARVTRFFHDAVGREVGRLDAEGYLVEGGYDRAGRRVRTTAYANITPAAQRVAGTLAQLRPAVHANDQITRVFHDGRGNAIAELNAEGYLTDFVFDEARNQRAVRSYALKLTGLTGSETLATLRTRAQAGAVRESRRDFDARGLLLTELDVNDGTVTRYSYDAQGRMLKSEAAHATLEQRDGYRRYDVFGNLVGELGGEGAVRIVGGMTPAQIDAVYAQYGVRHEVDALGRRIETTDAQGNKTWYFYDAASRLTQTVKGVADAQGVRNAEGEVTETRYTAFGEVRDTTAYTGRIAIAAPFGRDQVASAVQVLQYLASSDSRTQFAYDRRGQRLQRLDALGNSTTWNYNAFGDMTRQTLQIDGTRSLVTTSDYDRRGLRKLQIGDVGGVTQTQSWTYDAFGRVITAVDARNNSATFTYDRLGRQVSQRQTVSGRVEQSLASYDAWSRVLTQTDAKGKITRYVYDDVARSVRITTPEGVVVTTVHNRHGQTDRVTDAKGNATVYTYNKDGQLTHTRAADTGTTEQRYDARGLTFETLDATGRKVGYQYDAVGRVLARIEDPDGLALTTRYSYDGQGRQVSVTDAANVRTTMAYDVKGQLKEVVRDTTGLALKTTYTWDARGRALSITEGAGTPAAMTVAYAYDHLGRRTSETQAPGTLNLTTSYTYDGNDNVVARTDAAGRVTRYTYDEANRTVFAVDGAGGVVRNWYDANGRVVATRAYAQAINIASLPIAATTAAVQALVVANDARDVQQYQVFDNDGRVRLTIDSAGAVSNRIYDTASRQVRVVRYANAATMTAALRTQLQGGTATPAGVLAGVTVDAARDQDNFLVLDAVGRVRYMVATDGSVSEMRYDLAGRVAQTWSYATALTLSAADRTALNAGTLTAATLGTRLAPQSATARVQYSVFDAVGRERYSVLRSDASSGVASERQYDAVGRMVTQTRYGITIAFDPAQSEAGVAAAVQASLSVDAAVRATQVRTTRVVFDAAGRQRFALDASGAVSESRYDASGRVLESRRYGLRPPANTLTEAQLNTWGQAQVVADVRSTFSRYDAAGRVDLRTDGLGKTEQYVYDGTGLVTEYTDRNNAVWSYGYDAAGRRTSETSPSVTVATVDAAGTVTQASRRLITRIEYDGQGNVTKRTENADTTEARSTTYVYDNRGHQVQTIFPDAWQVNESTGELEATGQTPTIDITYDTLGRAVVQKDVRGNYSYKTYNALGQLVFEVDQEGHVTSYVYNAFGEQATLRRYNGALNTGVMSGWSAGQPVTVAHFQTAGALTTTAADRTIATTYDQRGNARTVVQTAVSYYNASGAAVSGSPTTQFEYDAYGQLAKESVLLEGTAGQPTARWADTFRYYDVLGRNTLTVDAEGYVTGTVYNATGEAMETIEYARALATQGLTTTTRPGTPAMGEAVTGFDRITRWQYDALGRKSVETAVRRYQRADGSAGLRNVDTTFAYDGESRITGLTTDAGTTSTAYDALGRATSVQEPARATLTASAENGLLASTNTDLGSAGLYAQVSPYTTVIYDAFGNAVQTRRYANGRIGEAAPVADAADQVQVTRYDRQGRAVMTKDAEGALVYSAYDQADNVLHRWYRLSGSEASRDTVVHGRYSYDRVGRQTVATQTHQPAAGGTAVTELSEQVAYNAFGEIAGKTYPGQAGALGYTYDAAGRVLTSNEGGATRTYGYNLAGHQVRESHQAYLAAGQIVEAVTWSTTDRLGRTVAVRLPSHTTTPTTSSAIEQQLDRWGNVVQVIDARGYQTNYQYNDFNQVVRDERPLVEVVSETGLRSWIRPVNQWFYDAFGRLLATKDANGNLRANEYDAAGRLTRSKDAYGNATLYAYDALGNQRINQNPLGYLTFKTYDRQNRITGIGDYLPGANGTTRDRVLLQRYTLNQNGDRLSVTDALNYAALYDYDGRSQLLRSQTSMGVVMNYAYNAQGKKTLERYPRVTDESVPDRWVEEEPGTGYWEPGWVDDGTRLDRENETIRVDEQTWDYDIHGRVVDYNNLSGRDYDYSYDAASGTLTADSSAGGAGPGGGKSIHYYANGRIREVVETGGWPTFRYEYDAAGNRTLEETIARDGSGALTHTVTRTLYDSHNRIERVTQDDLSGGPAKRVFDLLYAYDAVGNRRQVKALSGYGPNVGAVPVSNTAPTAIQPVSEKIVRTGLTSQFALLFSDIFRDAEQDALTLSIARSDNTALPAWLTVQHDPTTGEIAFIATPGAGDVNTDITVRLTARETANAANVATTDFVVRVRDNTPPQLIDGAVETIRVKTDKPWSREVSVADYFRDLDVGDRLTLSVVNAGTLPWAQIDTSNPSVVRLSGTPTTASTYTLQVRATDEKGASVVKTFQIITAANSGPQVVAVPGAQEAILGREFGWTRPLAGVFFDADGDALQVTATGMPAWMSYQYLIDQATPELKFAGRVPTDEVDGRVYAITLKAVDPDGAIKTTTLDVTVRANRAPAVVLPGGWTMPAIRVNDNLDRTISIATLFADPESDQVFIDPIWPTGSTLPQWLKIAVDHDAKTIRFYGKPTSNAQAGALSFQLRGHDGDGLSNVANVALTIGTDNAPVRNTAVPMIDQTLSISRSFSFTLPAGVFTDADTADTLNLSASVVVQQHEQEPGPNGSVMHFYWIEESPLPAWLSFNASTRTFSGTVPAGTAAETMFIRVSASDGRHSNVLTANERDHVGGEGIHGDTDLALHLAPFANAPPTYTPGSLPARSGIEGQAVDFPLPAGAFNEPNGDALTYSAQVQNSAGTWVALSTIGLSINAGTGQITGTLGNLQQTNNNIRIYASDPQGASVFGAFTLAASRKPVAPAPLSHQVSANQGFTYAVPGFSDPEGGALTYTATLSTGSALPAWMTFSSAGVLSGTPTALGNHSITVTATDPSGLSSATTLSLTVANDPPRYNGGLVNQAPSPGPVFDYVVPAGAFTDPNNDTLTFSADANGVALPSWLSFNAATRTFSGIPRAAGSWTIRVFAADPSSVAVMGSFVITVPNVAPTNPVALPNRAANQGQAVSWALPGGAFADANNDTLTYSLMVERPGYWEPYEIVPGEPDVRWVEPQWLASGGGISINAASGTITGSLALLNGENSYRAKVIARDPGGATVESIFNVSVNRVPTSYATTETVAANTAFARNVQGFADPDGSALTYSATLVGGAPLPAWLTLTSAGVLSGTAPSVATYQLQVTASDSSGATTSAVVTLNAVNAAPTYNAGTVPTTLNGTASVAFNYQIPAGAFSDPNGDVLTYSASLQQWVPPYMDGEGFMEPGYWESVPLPAWLSFNAATRTLSSASPVQGSYRIEFLAQDGAGYGATAITTLNFGAANAAPVAPTLNNQSAGRNQYWAYTVPAFSDANGDALTYSAGGMPAGITFNVSTRTFSGNVATLGSYTLTVTANDGRGGVTNASFVLTVGNTAPVPPAIPPQNTTAGVAWGYTIPAFSDPNGDALTYSVSGAPAWMSFNAGSRYLSGTPSTGASWTITVTATDPSNASASASFTVTTANSAPTNPVALPNRAANQGQAVSWALPGGAFADANNDTLTYSLMVERPGYWEPYEIVPGEPDVRWVEPQWLASGGGISINATSGTITGNLALLNGENSYRAKVIARDPGGATVESIFNVSVNRVPTSYATTETVAANTAFARNVQGFADPDGSALTYSATLVGGAPLPAWLTLTSAGVLSGTAPSVATYQLQVTASDSSGATTSAVVTLNAVNAAPTYNAGTVPTTLNGTASVAFNYQIPAGAFSDPNGDVLTYSASLQQWVPPYMDGEGFMEPGYWESVPLPAWLSFNAATRTLSSASPVQGSYRIEFLAQDGAGYGATAITTLNIDAAPNHAPVAPALNNQSAGRNQYWAYTVPAFSDANGDALTYSAGGMPAGITFNVSTRTFSGTVATLGSYTLTVTANDGCGGVTNASFVLTVGNTAPVPPAIPPQNTTAGVAWGYTIPAFSDPNGDALTYSVSGLPAWMAFTAGSRYLSGMPSVVGSWTVTVSATDPSGASASTSFTVTTPNRPPTVAVALPSHTIGNGQSWSFQFDANTFADANGDSLTYSAVGMPAGISFNGATRTFSGAANALGSNTVNVTANDGRGGSVSNSFTLTVGNSAPVHQIALPNRAAMQGQAVSWSLPAGSFTDANGDPLSYSAMVEIPAHEERYWNAGDHAWDYRPVDAQWVALSNSGLSINASTGTLSGSVWALTASAETFYDYRVQITATDPSSAAASGIFQIGINAAPTASGVPNQSIRANQAWSYVTPAFNDPNYDVLTYSASGLPAGLWFTPSTRTISGTPTAPGTYTVTIYADDGRGGAASTSFSLTVRANNVPVAPAVSSMSAAMGVPWSYTLPGFSDADYDTLTHAVANLPPGLGFNPATLTISGTPTTAGNYTVTYSANDGMGGVASTNFGFAISNTPPANRAPTLTVPLDDQYANSGYYFEYVFEANSFTDPDGNPLTYTATLSSGSALPTWLKFDAPNRRFWGTPSGAANAAWDVRVTATDPSGLSVSDVFNVFKEGTGGGGQIPNMQRNSAAGLYSFDMGSSKKADDKTAKTGKMGAMSPEPGIDGEPVGTATATALPYQTTEHWFTYDAENRLKVNNGQLVNGQIVVDAVNGESYELMYDAGGRVVARYRRINNGAGGTTDYIYRMTYDLRGQKTLEFHGEVMGAPETGGVSKSFTYSAAGQMLETRSFFANGTTRSLGKDAEGMPRGTINISGWLTGAEQMQYDRDGRMLSQLTKHRTTTNWGQFADEYETDPETNANQRTDLTVLADKNLLENTFAGGASGYDAAGRLVTYRFTEFGKYIHTYSSAFEAWSSYQEKSVSGVSSNTNYRTTTNTLSYDGMGRLISQREHTNYQNVDDRIRYYSYNGEARVQMRRSGTLNASQQFVQTAAADGSRDNVLFVQAAGQQQAELKEGGQTRVSGGGMYDTKQLQSLSGIGNYMAGGGKVTVQAGETLQSLAQRIYGTSQRWYVLADANGLSDPNQELIEGTQLNAPNVNVSSNDAGTFKPYNPGDAIGSTSPSLPYITPPPKQQCNALAMIIIVIVVIIVTVYTAGAAAGAMGVTGTAAGGGAATTAAVGGSVLAGGGAATGVALGATAGTFAAANMGLAIAASAFAGGVVGSIAGQAVGNLLGVRDGFSLREAFASGLTSMAGAGIGRMLGTASATNAMRFAGEPGKAAASAVLNGLSSYAANKVAGVEATFSWRSIAASAVAAAVTSVVAPKISGALGFDMATEGGQFGADLTSGLVGGVVGLHTRRAFGFDDPVNYGQIVADAFGNTVANYLVGAHKQQAMAQQVSDRRQQFVDQLTNEQGVAAGQSAEAMLHQLPLTLDEQAVRGLIADRLALTEESSIEQFKDVTGRYLRMAQLDGKNITDEEYDQTMANLFRRGTVTVLDVVYEGPVDDGALDGFENLGPTPYQLALNEQWQREETNPAFGHQLIDHGLQGVGGTVLRVGEAIESRPWLKWSLVGIEVAAGPALYGARQFIAATPVGRAIERAQEAIVEKSAERFVSNPGYESDDATRGGVGVMVALTLAAGGVAGLLRKLPAVQRTLTGIEARMSQLRYRHFPSSRVMSHDDFRSRFGSTFKSAREAELGWDWYQRAATGSGTLVIGRLPDTNAAATRGFERLNVTPGTEWTTQINDAWLQGAIDAGRPVRLVSPVSRSTLRNSPGSVFPDTIFRRELHQLRANGYTIQNGWAVPPRRR